MQKGFAVVVASGPSKVEDARFRDLVDSVRCFEPSECVGIVMIDDGDRDSRFLETLPPYPPVFRIRNPRKGRGNAWTGGHTVGIVAGYSFVDAHLDPEYILKLDSDALVIAPFHSALSERFRADGRIGLLGAHLHRDFPSQSGSAEYWGRQIRKSSNPLSITRQPGLEIRLNLGPAGGKLRFLLRQAYKSGYSLGESCQGGAYALRAEALHSMRTLGMFAPPLRFLGLQLTEDILFSLAVRAAGFELRDLNDSGEVFGVAWKGLLASPAELLRQGRSIIHSVKSSEGLDEKNIRHYFREERARTNAIRDVPYSD